ncbi:hypothetical protein ACB087_16975 [Vibrio sp. VNB-15]
MHANQLTGAQAKEAREHIGISLLSVSKLTGINRNDLTKFEQEKSVLSAEQKQKLVDCYSSRGYQFNALEHEAGYEDFKETKEGSLAQIREQFGADLANALELFYQEYEDIVLAQQAQIDTLSKQQQVSYPVEYTTLEKELIQHFTGIKDGKIESDSGFFGYNTDQSMKLMALMSLQYLRLLAVKHPDLIMTSQAKCEEGSDNYHILSHIAEHLDVRYPQGFAKVTSDAVK